MGAEGQSEASLCEVALTVAIVVAHAAFLPERRATLQRLRNQIGPGQYVSVSETREHASTWSRRLYNVGASTSADFVCLLNDDVEVCPDFVRVLEAMHSVRPNDALALHTTFPMARDLDRACQRWFRSFWITGPAYSFPMARLKRLQDYVARAPRWFTESRNEDNIAMQWLWSEQTPAWHPIPAVVKHDVTVPSSLGYDNHPLRQPTYTWEDTPSAELTTPSFWMPKGTPLLFECPWMPAEALEHNRQMMDGCG